MMHDAAASCMLLHVRGRSSASQCKSQNGLLVQEEFSPTLIDDERPFDHFHRAADPVAARRRQWFQRLVSGVSGPALERRFLWRQDQSRDGGKTWILDTG